MRRMMMAVLLGTVCGGLSATAGAVDLERFLREETFNDMKLSPTGQYLAATVPMGDSTAVAILRCSDMQLVGAFRPQKHNHADTFEWFSDQRLVIGLAKKFGRLDAPQATGELYGINADGQDGELLVGYRKGSVASGNHAETRQAWGIAADLMDAAPVGDSTALIEVSLFSTKASSQVERMDVLTGKRTLVVRSPIPRATFRTDAQGEVRFATGFADDRVRHAYYREAGSEWREISEATTYGRTQVPIGFSAEGQPYLLVEQPEGPDAIVAWDPKTDARRTVLRDAVVDPGRIIYQPGTRIPVGALFFGDTPHTRFFDEGSSTARLYRSLEAALKSPLFITSSTRDGGLVLVRTWSGRNPGDFYLYDTVKKHASLLTSRSHWIDAETTAHVQPVSLKARDGLPLHGYLTVPHGKEPKRLPLVVLPHGGPFGVFDDGSYERETQLLADAGYAVLQINFRGSSNYGFAHTTAGKRQWGGTMQDDVTDATRWVIDQGIADRDRVCLYGASYGAYAAMMGAIREPGLYRCAAGYVGVYDLAMMYNRGDTGDSKTGRTYLREWVGPEQDLAPRSVIARAADIKVPVFLAAGGEDERAPIAHTRRLEAALKKAGTPVEALYYKTEGHGFYTPAHQREYYTRLLAFLSRSLGGRTATPSTAAATP
ncbi:S9 family peptidase [Stenotrophomonas sp. PS02289]|uniref:alpha/beta hydrolase family protein n=1 Tax=Stenotrophomonas sp. PS02289 TaxID=2991422 RepID=UPI00249CBC4C|nr:S9 family peptidase [Stenotrophomonas sp. PS02289]